MTALPPRRHAMDQWGRCQDCGLAAVQIRERGALVCEGRPEEASAWRHLVEVRIPVLPPNPVTPLPRSETE